MKEFWDERFAGKEFAYGQKPNEYFRQFIDWHEPGKILLPADGEGRNGVYAAKKGWTVDIVDFSVEAKKKAIKLATEQKVNINYSLDNVLNHAYPEEDYDAVAVIFLHLLNIERKAFHKEVESSLKRGGYLIMEIFSKNQLGRKTGGPQVPELLYSTEQLINDFSNIEIVRCEEQIKNLNEGHYHKGEASVINFLGMKKDD